MRPGYGLARYAGRSSARVVEQASDQVPLLCEAVITTAQRARHAAWEAAAHDPQSTAISVTSWYRIAAANTVTSHHCHILCVTLADRRAGNKALCLSAAFRKAVEQAARAREQWLDSAREFREITTDVRGYISVAAIEAAELAQWTGRLAYADPGWTLAQSRADTGR